jgi:predicted nucleic-acid-binding protein
MRAVDTNVIVRYLTGDDPKQAAKARALIGHTPVFVPRSVLMEVEWVLRSVYDFRTDRIISALLALAGLPGVTLEDAALAAQAMRWAAHGMDFADALHLAAAAHCDAFVTFDKKFTRAAMRTGSVPVEMP